MRLITRCVSWHTSCGWPRFAWVDPYGDWSRGVARVVALWAVDTLRVVWFFYLSHRFCFVVLTILVSIRASSFAFLIIFCSSRYQFIHQEALSSHSRYTVSLASFSDIFALDKKSFLLWPSWASLIFAHILVQLLKSCLDIMNSLLFFVRCE